MKNWMLAFAFLMNVTISDAFVIVLESSDFGKMTEFSNVTNFSFAIDVASPLAVGDYSNPTLNQVVYSINGSLASTPSGFPAFALERDMSGAEFYGQGSSLDFEISTSANLADGLQVSELVGTSPIFVFNGREVDTGRYHPSLFELNGDGTGVVQNSNNFGDTVVNPSSNELVNVDFGEEYITNLTFDPSTLTLATVPEPSHFLMIALACSLPILFRRKQWKLIQKQEEEHLLLLKGLEFKQRE